MIENTTPQLYGTITQTSGGTENYNDLKNIPSINEVPLKGDLTTEDLGIEIPTKNSELENDSNYITLDDVPKTDLSDYYNKQETNNLLDEKQPTGDYALKNDIPDVSEFITNTVDDLVNYYKKSETYSQEEIDQKIADLHSVSFKKVEVLPETGEPNIIYLVPNEDEDEDNICDEYIYDNDRWEPIGSTKVDLTGYVTEDMLNEALENYYTSTQIDEILKNIDGIITTIDTQHIILPNVNYEPSNNFTKILNNGLYVLKSPNNSSYVYYRNNLYFVAQKNSLLYVGSSATKIWFIVLDFRLSCVEFIYGNVDDYNYTRTSLNDFLKKDNTTAYTPTGNFNPCTKIYADNIEVRLESKIGDISTVLDSLVTVEESV